MKTIFGLFLDYNDAVKAVDELYRQSYKHEEIQVLTEEATAKDITEGNQNIDDGHNLMGMLAGHRAMPVSGIGSVIAVGPLTTIFSKSALEPTPIQGGLVGAFKEMGMPEDTAAVYTDGINQAGVMLAVRTDDDRAASAANIMRRFNGREVGAYGLQRTRR